MPTFHLVIKGKVQGVFYRATAKEIADESGIKGWIKNTSDGNVEAMITGHEKQLQQFVEWCKKGPRKAIVSDVLATEQKEMVFTDFSVIR